MRRQSCIARSLVPAALETLESRRLLTVFTVTSTAQQGAGSLRQAILDANASSGANTIAFNIPDSGPVKIAPGVAMPSITANGLTIDGTTQPGYLGSPLVELSGQNADALGVVNGLYLAGNGITVKGLDITRWSGNGIYVSGTYATIVSNYIGVDPTGTAAAGSITGTGIRLAGNAIIGGASDSQRNIISGWKAGLVVSAAATISGNFIGTNMAGSLAIPNGIGVYYQYATGVLGGALGSGNVISGNSGDGIAVSDLSPNNASLTISYNRVGGNNLGNGGNGIEVGAPVNAAQNTYIHDNEISFNAATGVRVIGNAFVHSDIEHNSIYGNGGLGIDLNGDGPTANDANDADIGPNDLINSPVITTITGTTSNASIYATYTGAAGKTLTINLYGSDIGAASAMGEGKIWLGAAKTSTDAAGVAKFVVQRGTQLAAGQILTATVTDSTNGNTSEFSAPYTVADSTLGGTVYDVTGGPRTSPAGRTVYIDKNNNGQLDAGERSLVTSGTGSDSFGVVDPGTYVVREILPSGYGEYNPAGQLGMTVSVGADATASAFFYTKNTGTIANAGGPRAVNEGSATSLYGTSSTTPSGNGTYAFAWDLDYDGGAFQADATGQAATFSAAAIDGTQTRNVALRIIDGNGYVTIGTAPITVQNVVPTAVLSGSTVTLGGASVVQFSKQADPSPADTAAGFTYVYDYNNDGNFNGPGEYASGASFGTYTYSAAGTYTVRARIADKDGGYTDYTTTVTVTAPTSSTAVLINAGGGAAGDFAADNSFTGGYAYSTSAAVDTSTIINAGPPAVYQTQHAGQSFSYSIGGLTAGKQYAVELDFAELYWSSAGNRLINVTGNGAAWLSNFDIYAAAGAKNKAISRTYNATADAGGKITVALTGVKDIATLSALRVLQVTQASPTPTLINAGGSAAGSFAADSGFSGGSPYSTTSTIDVSDITDPGPQTVYQTERAGQSFSYSVTGLTAGKQYVVELDFAELYWSSAGNRLINVAGNGAAWLSNFDIYAAAGAKNKAIARTFTATADASGKIAIAVTGVKDIATLTALRVSLATATQPVATPVYVNAGGGAAGNFAADNAFTNGSPYSTTAAIDTSALANPGPQSVYQTERAGQNFSYALTNLVPGQAYSVELDFAELYWLSAGNRLINVTGGGTSWLTNFDIYAAAGAMNKAVSRTFTSTANTSGQIVIGVAGVKDIATLSAISIVPA